MKKQSQADQILNHMQQGKPITPIDALNLFGCFRLGARIHELKKSGYPIVTETVNRNGKQFARYSLALEKRA